MTLEARQITANEAGQVPVCEGRQIPVSLVGFVTSPHVGVVR